MIFFKNYSFFFERIPFYFILYILILYEWDWDGTKKSINLVILGHLRYQKIKIVEKNFIFAKKDVGFI